jgi:hypothetical protein
MSDDEQNKGKQKTLLTSALDEGEWASSRLFCFTLGETAPILIG